MVPGPVGPALPLVETRISTKLFLNILVTTRVQDYQVYQTSPGTRGVYQGSALDLEPPPNFRQLYTEIRMHRIGRQLNARFEINH